MVGIIGIRAGAMAVGVTAVGIIGTTGTTGVTGRLSSGFESPA
jgi:hypothetical protein